MEKPKKDWTSVLAYADGKFVGRKLSVTIKLPISDWLKLYREPPKS